MANSKLLKEAIADAKAVRETAIANAKLALEEAFTPRLQSILSRKLQAEMEEEEDEVVVDEELDSSEIGKGEGESGSGTDANEPEGYEAHTELDPETTEMGAEGGSGEEDENLEVVDDLVDGVGYDDPTNADDASMEEDEMELDEDELDLEEIIRELESELEDEDEEVHTEYEHEDEEEFDIELEEDEELDIELEEDEELDIEMEDEEELDIEMEDEEEVHTEEDEFSDEIDLDEILREMGYGDDEEEVHTEEEMEDDVVDNTAELETELDEAYSTIKSLRKTINEVNLLNAKLLYTNKLFRSYNLTTEQKMKVVENLDRTGSVREVKLVYTTLAESMNFSGTERKGKKNITEGFASKAAKSTAPKKEIISEANQMADRFKQLAGLINK
jgi:hypothetical protein